LDSGSLPSGTLCSAWKNLSFSYLIQTGSSNGAGLRVEILSPVGCASTACTYYTGMTTVYKSCL
jgi:hypothetical protein